MADTAARTVLQVVGGLLEEALMLLDVGLPPNSNMATKAIGYRQAMTWWQGLLGQLAPPATAAGGGASSSSSRLQDGQLLSEQLKQRFQPAADVAQPPQSAAGGQQAKRQESCVPPGMPAVEAAADEQALKAQDQQPSQQQPVLTSTEELPPAAASVPEANPAPQQAPQQAQAVPQVTPAQVLQLAADVATASRNLVKSQYTYFRDEPLFAWVEASDHEAAFQTVAAALEAPHHAGNCGDHDSGRLDAAAQKALRLYAPRWQLLKQGEVMEGVLGWVHQVLAQRAAAAAAPTEGSPAAAAPVPHGVSQQQQQPQQPAQ
jgi:hypothetical protein